jgi:hypothetical protein
MSVGSSENTGQCHYSSNDSQPYCESPTVKPKRYKLEKERKKERKRASSWQQRENRANQVKQIKLKTHKSDYKPIFC